ncbi:MAG: hypothetical protein KDA71_11930 [Planctomycetales bacterium]|nr:hypothetical protein [Planctomycetales bacterium]
MRRWARFGQALSLSTALSGWLLSPADAQDTSLPRAPRTFAPATARPLKSHDAQPIQPAADPALKDELAVVGPHERRSINPKFKLPESDGAWRLKWRKVGDDGVATAEGEEEVLGGPIARPVSHIQLTQGTSPLNDPFGDRRGSIRPFDPNSPLGPATPANPNDRGAAGSVYQPAEPLGDSGAGSQLRPSPFRSELEPTPADAPLDPNSPNLPTNPAPLDNNLLPGNLPPANQYRDLSPDPNEPLPTDPAMPLDPTSPLNPSLDPLPDSPLPESPLPESPLPGTTDPAPMPPGINDGPGFDFEPYGGFGNRRTDCDRVYNQRNCCEDEERCRSAREFVKRNTIRTISLDITPRFKPDDPNLEDSSKREQLSQAPTRLWRNREGEVVADGRFVDYQWGRVYIEDEAGNVQKIPPRTLSDDDQCFLAAFWNLPTECSLGDIAYVPRNWMPMTMTWKASALCHKPLYFEEVQLERYGHTAGPIVQPVLSGAHFFLNIAVLPYKTGINPPTECQYALGYYRPGSCAPWLLPPVPISVRGALYETGAVLGGIYLIP